MKVFVSDFDHCFYTIDFDKNVELVRRFVDAGNIFIIATGRNINQLLSEIDGYDLPCQYYICNDGALIYNQNLEIIHRVTIPQPVVGPIFEILDRDRSISETLIDADGEYTSFAETEASTIIARPMDKKKAEQLLQKILDRFPEVQGYISEQWLNISSKNASKGNAVKFLELLNHYEYRTIYTLGDNINDISMNDIYTSFAITNGCEDLCEVSNYQVTDFAEALFIIDGFDS